MAKGAKAPTKSEIFTTIAKDTGLSRKQIAGVFDSLTAQLKKSLKKCGGFGIPGLAKVVVKRKPAVPAGERMNPFTKQMQMFAAKPAKNVVRIRPIKAVKDMV